MRKSAKRFLSTVLAMALLCSCMAVTNISTVFAADSYTFTPDTDTFGKDVTISSRTAVTFTGGSNYIAAMTGPEVIGVGTDESFESTVLIPMRASRAISSHVYNDTEVAEDDTLSGYDSYSYYANSDDTTASGTFIILSPATTGTFTAKIGIDSRSNTRTVKLWDNTDDKDVASMTTTKDSTNGKTTYTFGGDTLTTGDAVDSSGTVTLAGGHEYILYNSGFTARLGEMTFTLPGTDPAVSISVDSATIEPESTAIATATLTNVDEAAVSWSSGNEAVATVEADSSDDKTATIIGVANGTATIIDTITVDSIDYTGTVEITVDDGNVWTVDSAIGTIDFTDINTYPSSYSEITDSSTTITNGTVLGKR